MSAAARRDPVAAPEGRDTASGPRHGRAAGSGTRRARAAAAASQARRSAAPRAAAAVSQARGGAPSSRVTIALGGAVLGAGLGLATSQEPLGVAGLAGLVASLTLLRAGRAGLALAAMSTAALVVGDARDLGLALLLGAAAFQVAWHRALPVRLVALVVLAATSQLCTTDDAYAPNMFCVVVPFCVGWALGDRARVARELAARSAELQAERGVYADLSVRYERARIAAELHDIVGHAIAVMVVQASAGQRMAGRDPAAARATFAAIGEAARTAQADMERLVSLLQSPGPGRRVEDLALVDELVARAAGSGLDVTLTLTGDADGLPPSLADGAFLVVREGLTNALKHAPGAPVRVVIDAAAGTVEVVNGPPRETVAAPGRGGGNGLRGLRERLDAAGGRLDAGPTPDGGWRLAVRVPVAPDPLVRAVAPLHSSD